MPASLKGDIGQLDPNWPYHKSVRMVARNDPDTNARWELLITKRWQRVTLWLFNESHPEGREVALSSFASVVGFFLMRAVCRGINESEVHESEHDVRIDCGVMPPA